MTNSKIILIAGPSGSGKSTLAHGLSNQLRESGKTCSLISLDNYYRDLGHLPPDQRSNYNFDQPDAWEFDRIINDAKRIQSGQAINVPNYDFATHLRTDDTLAIVPTDFIILEGIFALCCDPLNQLAELRIYVSLDNETALERRIARDTIERGRTRESVISQFRSMVIPSNENYIIPSSKFADIQVQGNADTESQLEKIADLL